MKRFSFFCLSLLMGIPIYAQSESGNALEFVDSEGNVIESGSTVVCDKANVSSVFGTVTVHSGISVKNMTSIPVNCVVRCAVEDMPSGVFQICGFGGCNPIGGRGVEYPCSGETTPNTPYTINGGQTVDTRSEWLQVQEGDYGSFTATYILEGYSTIFVKFVYADPTGISNSIVTKEKNVVGYYNINGQRLDGLQKGVNIVRYSDGTSTKILKD